MRPALYETLGLRVQTALDLPCQRAAQPGPVDLQVTPFTPADLAAVRAHILADTDRWFRHVALPDRTTYLRWAGLFEFLISCDGRRIAYRSLGQATPESLVAYLLGQVLSFSLIRFGVEPLHGTVVTINGRGVGLVGDCGYGKSTLAAALLSQGWRLVTDDVVALQERAGEWRVHPGLARIKLFPSVARRFRGSATGTRMNEATPKLMIPLAPSETVWHAVPLSALYVLSPPSRRIDGVRIDPLQGRAAFLEVIRSAFNLMVVSRERLANQFAFATRVASQVPIRRITYPRTFTALPGVADAIVEDVTRKRHCHPRRTQ